MILILDRKVTKEEIPQLLEAYPDYIKTVMDMKEGLLAVGGEYHIDCEEVLLKSGSKQEDLFGGGYRISTKEVEYSAMTNYKPGLGYTTYELADKNIREELEKITRKFLEI